jgi:hypothetical protein
MQALNFKISTFMVKIMMQYKLNDVWRVAVSGKLQEGLV